MALVADCLATALKVKLTIAGLAFRAAAGETLCDLALADQIINFNRPSGITGTCDFSVQTVSEPATMWKFMLNVSKNNILFLLN